MPLTLERDGIFRGRRDNHQAWYIVDPSLGGSVEEAERAWRAHYAPTNKPAWQRTLRGVIFFVTWGVVTVAAAAGVPLIPVLSPVGQVAAVFGISIAGLVLAGFLLLWVSPYRAVKPLGDLSVVGIPSPIVEWADDNTPVDDLWRLVTAFRDLEDVRALIDLIGVEWWLATEMSRPDTAIEKLVEPILREEWEKRRRHLIGVGAELNFEPPADTLAGPSPMLEYRES
jgi:hypothetical protein